MKRSKSASGFTLLELLLVLLIISLGSALIVPKLSGSLASMELKTSAKKVAAVLRYAGNKAVSEKTVVTAVFNVYKNRLTLIYKIQPVPEIDIAPKGEDDNQEQNEVYNLPDGIRMENLTSMIQKKTEDTSIIYFYPDGRSSGGELTILSERGTKYKIIVDFITGVITQGEDN